MLAESTSCLPISSRIKSHPRDQNIMRGCTTVPPGPALAPLISAFCRASSALTLWLARGVARVASRAGTWREALEGVLTGCAAESSAKRETPPPVRPHLRPTLPRAQLPM